MKEKILELHQSGLSTTKIAYTFKIKPKVTAIITRNVPRVIQQLTTKSLIYNYKLGTNLNNLAKIYKAGKRKLINILKENNIKINENRSKILHIINTEIFIV